METEESIKEANYTQNFRSFNANLATIILDYLPIKHKFTLIQYYRWNANLINTLQSMFLEWDQNICKFKISGRGVINNNTSNLVLAEEQQCYVNAVLNNKIYQNSSSLESNNTFSIEYISPKFLFLDSGNSIDSEGANIIYKIAKAVFQKNKTKNFENLKYYPVNLSSMNFNQSIEFIAGRYSKLYELSGAENPDYWISYPSIRSKNEHIILKMHPNLCLINSIFIKFYRMGQIYNCQYITISFGFTEEDYYFTTGKIKLKLSDHSLTFDFNTVFLANYLKIEFFDKSFEQLDNDQGDYFVALHDLKIKGLSAKGIINKNKILYENIQKYAKQKNHKNMTNDISIVENMRFFNESLFLQTEEYIRKMTEIDAYVEKMQIFSNFNVSYSIKIMEILKFFNLNHKFIKLHADYQLIMDFIKKYMPNHLFSQQVNGQIYQINEGQNITQFCHTFKVLRIFTKNINKQQK